MKRSQLLLAMLGLACLFGCTQPATEKTESDDRPASYAAGITQLKELQSDIKSAFDNGTPNECDGALHVAAKLLPSLGEVAADDGMAAEDVETVKAKSKELFDQLMKIHEGFHGGEEDAITTAYESVSTGIDESVDALAAISQ